MMFARLDFSTFLICCSGDLSDNESDEKVQVTGKKATQVEVKVLPKKCT